MSTFLAFDFGERRIGVATGQTTTGTAQGIDTVSQTPSGPDWAHIARLINQWQPEAVVVGLPVRLDGVEGPAAERARQFGDALRRRFNLGVHFVDERLTTVAADQELRTSDVKGRKVRHYRDRVAARYILQSFLDHRSRRALESG